MDGLGAVTKPRRQKAGVGATGRASRAMAAMCRCRCLPTRPPALPPALPLPAAGHPAALALALAPGHHHAPAAGSFPAPAPVVAEAAAPGGQTEHVARIGTLQCGKPREDRQEEQSNEHCQCVAMDRGQGLASATSNWKASRSLEVHLNKPRERSNFARR